MKLWYTNFPFAGNKHRAFCWKYALFTVVACLIGILSAYEAAPVNALATPTSQAQKLATTTTPAAVATKPVAAASTPTAKPVGDLVIMVPPEDWDKTAKIKAPENFFTLSNTSRKVLTAQELAANYQDSEQGKHEAERLKRVGFIRQLYVDSRTSDCNKATTSEYSEVAMTVNWHTDAKGANASFAELDSELKTNNAEAQQSAIIQGGQLFNFVTSVCNTERKVVVLNFVRYNVVFVLVGTSHIKTHADIAQHLETFAAFLDAQVKVLATQKTSNTVLTLPNEIRGKRYHFNLPNDAKLALDPDQSMFISAIMNLAGQKGYEQYLGDVTLQLIDMESYSDAEEFMTGEAASTFLASLGGTEIIKSERDLNLNGRLASRVEYRGSQIYGVNLAIRLESGETAVLLFDLPSNDATRFQPLINMIVKTLDSDRAAQVREHLHDLPTSSPLKNDLKFGSTISAAVVTNDGQKWFFEGKRGDVIDFTLNGMGLAINAELMDSDEKPIFRYGSDESDLMIYPVVLQHDGRYYLHVTTRTGLKGHYTLLARKLPAKFISIGETKSGKLGYEDDQQVWVYEAKAGETLLVAASGFGSGLGFVTTLQTKLQNADNEQHRYVGVGVLKFTTVDDGLYVIQIRPLKESRPLIEAGTVWDYEVLVQRQ